MTKLNGALNKTLALPQTKERFASLGAEVWASTPGEFTAFIREDITKWRRLAKQLDMKLE